MGVRGLQSFLKNNATLSQKIELNNTSLVIDAGNLTFFLYAEVCNRKDSESWRSDIYGGDSVMYAEVVRKFFDSLDKCNITPILVLDGSVIGKQSTQDQIVLKEKEVYRRGLERLEGAKCMNELNPNEKLMMTSTISNVFKNIVVDLGIQRVPTPYEADAHIARIACDLNCFVLTNDSDFIIYPLPKGFIILDTFLYKNIIPSKNGYSVPCLLYSQRQLMKTVPGLKKESLPLMSVLLGNDYVEAGTFDRVTDQICNQYYSGVLNAETRSHRKIANLLDWLRSKGPDETIDYILARLHPSSREKLRRTIKVLLRSYLIEETDNFESELQTYFPTNRADPKFNIHPELMPPAYLRRLFETTDLNAVVLDMIFHNTHYCYPVVDDFQLISASYVKYRIFAIAVTLLRPISYSGLTTNRRQAQLEKDTFYVFDRLREEYGRLRIRPLDELEEFGSLEHLNFYTTITLEPSLKKSLFFAAFRYNTEEFSLLRDTVSKVFSGPFIYESTICFLLIKYIGLETKTSPKAEFVDAIMLTMFYYAALNGQLKKDAFQDAHYGKLLLRLRPHSIKNNGRQYEQSFTLYRRIVHFISQLQYAYAGFSILNNLLNQIVQVPRYEKFFNSTLIFRITKLLRLGEFKLDNLCQEMALLLETCGTVKVLVHCD